MTALAEALDRLLQAHRESAFAHLSAASGDIEMALAHVKTARRALADAHTALRAELTRLAELKEHTP